ncbi:MAG: hypothetical protein ABJB11_08560 [Ferruginibacter sp.]
MQSITRTYLTDIIYRMMDTSIQLHRASKGTANYGSTHPHATDEEIIDFIVTIPYLDEELKYFLLGNEMEETIIISQSWEIEFIKKCASWVQSFEWLMGDNYYLSDAHISSLRKEARCLTLPY